ncbi:flippase-like domain-containing protein [Sutcliffiella horikoshii]|uniref:flippase-like domain-containing protein n=1 Tax=Bacillaceae TaxID=186817 RepID=UPI0001E89233|nr:flippase-like domain-containing protein [Bacillus sp. m3-13]
MQLFRNTYFLKVLKVVFPLTILIVLYIEGKKQIQSINMALVMEKIRDIGFFSFTWLIILGVLAVSTMIFYDLFISSGLKVRIPARKLAVYGFSSNSFANFMGFGGFAGVGLRTLYYRKYARNFPLLLKSVTIILPYMLCGLSIFAWWVVIYEWTDPTLLLDYPILKLPLLIMSGYLFFIFLASHFTKSLNIRQQLILIGISFLEWFFAGIVFWQTSVLLNVDVPVLITFTIFFMAAIAGVLSTVPGGVGAFDFVVLVGFASFGVYEEKLVALLLLYRLVYYVAPFLISSVVFFTFMFKEKAWKSLLPEGRSWSIVCHRILSIWVLIVGALLVLFPVIPAIVRKITIANEFLSMEMMQVSHQFSITIGITLLVLARAIEDKVKRAYYFTFFILAFGTLVSFSKGFHFWEAVLFLVAMLLLYFSRRLFYRKSSQYTFVKGLIDGVILLAIALIYVIVGSLQISYIQRIVPKRLQDLFSLDTQSLWQDVGFGVLLAIALIYFGLFFKRWKESGSLFQTVPESDEHIAQPLLNNKPIYFYSSDQGNIYYQKCMDNLIVMERIDCEPDSHLQSVFLCQKFENEMDRYGFTVIIPSVKEEEVSSFRDAGFQIIEEDEKIYALSNNVPQIVAKTNIKWLNRMVNKMA